ncbi:double-strand break repair protein AddB [Pelagibacterium xiamenense]|uniref:double-strand break repair protein AddB n=1 Tax=Pelagibacterium xiamenense TaxID=2901140 RepID=UPI001E425202|nr:double-strand break repair protein AddB [Pelagibacterium xiamenense]MCD7058583.1 double-strand break repair protein AddB [Pelagibacterium xiamenense]
MSAAGKIYSIGPHAAFLPTLAKALIDGTLVPDWPREGPFWLSDITILLPTRRARNALADALIAQMGEDPLLLPNLKALGGEDPSAEPFLPPYEAEALPAPVGRMKRRLMLAQLVEKWLSTQSRPVFSGPGLGGYTGAPNPAEVLALADTLGTLIDDFTIAQKSSAALGAIDDAQLAAQWQTNLDFVHAILEAWPAILAEDGEIDAAARTNALLARQAQGVAALYGDKPVIVAGSTGSIPATADLMAAISKLPRGAIVLPGVDTAMGSHQYETLLEDKANPHGHPHYGLARLLRRLGVPPSGVIELAEPDQPRTRFLRTALALADDTAGWSNALEPSDIAAATDSVATLVARTPEEEARAIALAVRDGLDAGRSVAVISPDQTLARRIGAELARFDVTLDDAAGTPLIQSRAGRLVRQVVTLVCGQMRPVDLIALLHNRHAALGMGRGAVAAATEWLDFGVLRGQRPAPGFAGLRKGVAANLAGDMSHPALKLDAEKAEAISALLDALEAALEPLARLCAGPAFSAADFAAALDDTLTRLRASSPDTTAPPLEGEGELARWIETTAALGPFGPRYSARGLDLALSQLMAGESVRPRQVPADDAVIYGRLEARLMRADLMILAGLNEGVWPEIADPGPWMSRGMRMAAGLEPPEKLHGLAAHDFLMAAGAPNVILTRAERSGTSPSTPSRLLQRIEALAGEEVARAMVARGAVWVDAAARIDAIDGPSRAATRPAPRPPAEIRPRSLSVTEAETLLRSPYDLYAKYVLGLRPVDPLGADPDAAERGTIIHDIFGDYVIAGRDPSAPDAHETLMEIAQARFAGLEAIPERRDIWLRRFSHAARQFIAFERGRAGRVARRNAEIDGKAEFAIGGEAFVLRGRADRIDVLTSGGLEFIDFKTGQVPTPAEMKDFLAPQLPLEATMALAGGFGEDLRADAEALSYVKIANGPKALEEKPFALGGTGLAQAIEESFARFSRHVEALLMRGTQPMMARVLPKPSQRFKGAYEHLARTGEWTLADAEEEEE